MPKLIKPVAGSSSATTFVRRSVTLHGKEKGKDAVKVVEAECVGELAVHEVVFKDDIKKLNEERHASRNCWCVSSARCGLRMVAFLDLDLARRVAAWLHAEWGEVLERLPEKPSDAQRQCVRTLPAWVVAWCRAVQRERKWVEPADYKGQKLAAKAVAANPAGDAAPKRPTVAAGSVQVKSTRKLL